jgi:hypothetical protein
MEKTPKPTLEHQNVPENHQGLHDFLYDGSGDEHGVSHPTPVAPQSHEIVNIESWLATVEDQKIAGVYAVFDQQQQAQYIGYSRNVGLSLRGHITDNGPQICAWVRVQTFQFPNRSEMEALRDAWIAETGSVPPGNEGDGTWAATVGASAATVMSASEREAHEAKKLKLRTAMADETLQKEKEAAANAENRRSAVEADDWSALIDGQTQETR